MKGLTRLILLSVLPINLAFANCDLTNFRWQCDMPLHVRPQHYAHSLVYCGNAYGYVSQKDYETLVNYQRADVNMILTINDEYAASPCIAHNQ